MQVYVCRSTKAAYNLSRMNQVSAWLIIHKNIQCMYIHAFKVGLRRKNYWWEMNHISALYLFSDLRIQLPYSLNH